jgi:hypothetical protein
LPSSCAIRKASSIDQVSLDTIIITSIIRGVGKYTNGGQLAQDSRSVLPRFAVQAKSPCFKLSAKKV